MIDTIYTNKDFLSHHGIKGQKWGVRRFQNEDGTLTNREKAHERQIKKDAIKGYSQDAYNANKGPIGKAYDKITGAHKYAGSMMYDAATKEEREARAQQYRVEHQMGKNNATSIIDSESMTKYSDAISSYKYKDLVAEVVAVGVGIPVGFVIGKKVYNATH